MSTKRKINTTKKEIIQVAMRMFLENGFTETSVKSISDELGISTGNLTFHYPTKEHLLSVLVRLLYQFHWLTIEELQNEGSSDLLAFCIELPMMASLCEENAVARDFYLSCYSMPMTLDIIRSNDMRKAKHVFREFCAHWTDEDFAKAENTVSGIEYATMMNTKASPALPARISGALDAILYIYGVDSAVRRKLIDQVLEMDYRSAGRQVMAQFYDYVCRFSEDKLEQLLRGE